MSDLKIETVSKDRYFDFITVEGLSVEEMKYVLEGNGDGKQMNDRLCVVMEKHGKSIDDWRWGYGIYSIKHIGGHLLVEIGNNCD